MQCKNCIWLRSQNARKRFTAQHFLKTQAPLREQPSVQPLLPQTQSNETQIIVDVGINGS